MLERLEITNYRSIAQATVDFRPFTVVVGANGSGKSNLLKLLADLSAQGASPLQRHFNQPAVEPVVGMVERGQRFRFFQGFGNGPRPAALRNVRVFTLDPSRIAAEETPQPLPTVGPSGEGVVQVLDSLKTGDREDLFDKIEAMLTRFVPEIEKLSSVISGPGHKRLQVREKDIAKPVLVSDLSEGTRLVLTLLTIMFQERRPSILCIEDLDRGLHPALFGQIVEACRTLTSEPDAPQIVATTHNPYLVDQFIDDEDAVIIAEKDHGNTTFTSLATKLAGRSRGDDSLGGVWYSGLVGGGPVRSVKHLPSTNGA